MSPLRRIVPFLTLCAALLPTVSFATSYVTDPLTAASNPGRGGSRGGSFSASGFTTSAADDTVWYEISDALESGSVEYTVTGLSLATTLLEGDNEMLAVYQAPEGVSEPINYTPYYRNNDMKVFTRIFGAAEGGTRAGSYKLELAMCMMGPPYYDNTCGAGCPGVDTFAYARGNPTDVGWDPAASYRMGFSWGNGTMTFTRDGEVLGSVSYPGTYAPKPLRIRLGTPRAGQVGGATVPLGITFSNVVIQGTAGSQTPFCGAPTPDAGVPPQPDAGCTAATARPLQDATAASWTAGVFPDASDLNVEGDGSGNPSGVVYLKFPPLGGTASHAVLRLHTQASASAGGGSGQVCRVDDDSWSEGTLTFANRPPLSTVCTGGARSVGADSEVEWDVTALMTGSGNQNLAIVSADPDGAHFVSREQGDCARGPRLVADVVPPGPDAGAAVDAGAVPPDAGISWDAAVPPGPDGSAGRPDSGLFADPDGGPAAHPGGPGSVLGSCGCGSGGLALPALAMLAAGVIRRRQRC